MRFSTIRAGRRKAFSGRRRAHGCTVHTNAPQDDSSDDVEKTEAVTRVHRLKSFKNTHSLTHATISGRMLE